MVKLSSQTIKILEKAVFLKTVPDTYDLSSLKIQMKVMECNRSYRYDIMEKITMDFAKMMIENDDLSEEFYDALNGALYLLDKTKLFFSSRELYKISILDAGDELISTLTAVNSIINYYNVCGNTNFKESFLEKIFQKEDIEYVNSILAV